MILMTCASSEQSGVIQVPARIEQGWVSRVYAQRQPAPVAVMEIEGKGVQRFMTIIVPVSDSCHVGEFFERVKQLEAKLK